MLENHISKKHDSASLCNQESKGINRSTACLLRMVTEALQMLKNQKVPTAEILLIRQAVTHFSSELMIDLSYDVAKTCNLAK